MAKQFMKTFWEYYFPKKPVSIDNLLQQMQEKSIGSLDIHPVTYPMPVARVGSAISGFPPSHFLRYVAGNLFYQESIDLNNDKKLSGLDDGLALIVLAEQKAGEIAKKYADLEINVHARSGPLSSDVRAALLQYAESVKTTGKKYSA